MMMQVRRLAIPHVVAGHARWAPQAVAAVCGEEQLAWRALVARMHRVANGLRASGLGRDDKVAVLMTNSMAMLEVMLGIVTAGAVLVPLSPLSTPDVLVAMLRASRARALFVGADTRALVEGQLGECPAVAEERRFGAGFTSSAWRAYESWAAEQSDQEPGIEYGLDDSFSILYTSGTTGTPKGMEHTHLARLLYPLGLGPLLKIDGGARTVLTTPMYHNGTWVTMLPTLYAGGTVVIMPKFRAPEFVDAVERHAGTHAFMVPTQLITLLADPGFDAHRLRSLRVIEAAGSPLSAETFADIRRKLPHVGFCEMYGMGEGFITYAGPEDYARGKGGSVGRPIASVDTDVRVIGEDGREVAVGEIGEIVGTSAVMMKGYHGDPQRTRESVWTSPEGRMYLRSGDLGRFDPDGYLHLVGRQKDVIISGGVNVYASDIEEVFMRHPDVLEVAAIAVPDDRWGETPLLLVIMRPAARTSEQELRDWGNAQLGKAQRVSAVEFRAAFPRNALEKIVKRELREPYWRGRARDIA